MAVGWHIEVVKTWAALADSVLPHLRRPMAVVSLVYACAWAGVAVTALEKPGAATFFAGLAIVCAWLGARGLRRDEAPPASPFPPVRKSSESLPRSAEGTLTPRRYESPKRGASEFVWIGEGWYLLRDGVESGPHSMEEVSAMIEAGEINPGDGVRHGEEEWKPAELSYYGTDLIHLPGPRESQGGAWWGVLVGLALVIVILL